MEKPSRWLDVPSSVLGGGRARMLRVAAVAGLFLLLTFLYSSVAVSGRPPRHRLYTGAKAEGVAQPSRAERRLMDAAGNATLGFGSVQFINLPGRFDRLDAATLQAWLSGVDITEARGVLAAEISDVGMPPEHLTRVKKTEKGCWRAHANIWSQMLRDKTPAVLILESDAAWDVEVRAVTRRLNQHLTYLLDALQSRALPNPSFHARSSSSTTTTTTGGGPLTLDPSDPWHSTHWDVLSLGQCFEDPAHKDAAIRYPDPHVAPGSDYWGDALGAERVVRRSGGMVCTTAYAVSQTGAAKLLLRSAVDLDNPVDLVMRRMTLSGDLVVYSVMPTVFGQWEYIDGIGMYERGANSDIQGGSSDGALNLTGWETVARTGSVWQNREGHASIAFTDMALERAWGMILGETTLAASQFNETDGN